MTVIISYETISPIVLANLVERTVPCAVCRFSELNEDSFEFSVGGWLPLTAEDLKRVAKILASYA